MNLTQRRKGAEEFCIECLAGCAFAPLREHTWLIAIAFAVVIAVSMPAHADESGILRLTLDGNLKQRPAWSPDGAWLSFTRHQGATIFLFLRSADGATEKRLTTRKDPEFDAAWSPDGKRLAFCFDKTVPNQGDMDVYVIGADGEDLKPVLTSSGKLSHEEWPSWSSDGQWLALSSTRDGNQEIYVVRPDGKDLRRLTSDPAIDAHPAWSPDGQRIVFATSRWGDFELAVVNVDGSGLTRITQSAGLDDYPAWSPDGRRIAFASNRDGNLEIYACDPDGKNARNLTRNAAIDNFPTWTQTGDVTFVSNRDSGFDLYTMPGSPSP
jgi:TolB protein